MAMIRLLIADDHPVVREGLKRIVAECPDMRWVGEATDALETLAKSKTADVDVLLLDISMPGAGFLDTMRRLRKERPDLAVLVLSVHSEDQYAVRALRAGAAGYLTKDHSPGELADAIRRVYRGDRYVTPSVAEKLVDGLGSKADRPAHEALSDREYEILCMLGAGKSVKAIGRQLALSPKTVSTYRGRTLEKMKLKTSAELIRYALQNGLAD